MTSVRAFIINRLNFNRKIPIIWKLETFTVNSKADLDNRLIWTSNKQI